MFQLSVLLLAFIPMALTIKFAHFPGLPQHGISGELYDPYSQKCCHGVTFPKKRNSVNLCCGNTTFDFTEQICCHDHVQALSSGSRTACCGHTTYDVKKALCCMGRVQWLPKGAKMEDLEYFECCEAKAVDTRTSACCMGQVVKKSSPIAQCCGSSTFDPQTQVCCSDHIKESLGPHTRCCLDKPYSTDTDMCCPYTGEVLGSPWINASCCGQEAYDEKKQVCCQDAQGNFHLSPRPSDLGPRESACCGAVPYDYLKQTCCNDTVYDLHLDFVQGYAAAGMWTAMCCGDQMVDTESHLCCDGKTPVEKGKEFDSCCGDQPYSYQTQTCCYNNGSFKMSDIVGDGPPGCCAGASFDRRTHLCCFDHNHLGARDLRETLVERSTPSTQCCGSQSFDSKENICCQGRTYPRPTWIGDWACCGQVLFNPATHECCDLVVKQVKDESKRGCCSVLEVDDVVLGCTGRGPLQDPYLSEGAPAEYENEALLAADD